MVYWSAEGCDPMTIRKRLARSNLIMILIPVAIAAAVALVVFLTIRKRSKNPGPLYGRGRSFL